MIEKTIIVDMYYDDERDTWYNDGEILPCDGDAIHRFTYSFSKFNDDYSVSDEQRNFLLGKMQKYTTADGIKEQTQMTEKVVNKICWDAESQLRYQENEKTPLGHLENQISQYNEYEFLEYLFKHFSDQEIFDLCQPDHSQKLFNFKRMRIRWNISKDCKQYFADYHVPDLQVWAIFGMLRTVLHFAYVSGQTTAIEHIMNNDYKKYVEKPYLKLSALFDIDYACQVGPDYGGDENEHDACFKFQNSTSYVYGKILNALTPYIVRMMYDIQQHRPDLIDALPARVRQEVINKAFAD